MIFFIIFLEDLSMCYCFSNLMNNLVLFFSFDVFMGILMVIIRFVIF